MDKATKRTIVFSAFVVVIGIMSVAGVSPPASTTTTKHAVTSTVAPVTRLPASDEDTLAKFARDRGYICNRVVGSRRLLSEVGITLHCENWTYDFHQKAGRWAITPRKLWGQ